MVTRIINCYHCGSENIVKHGLTKNGKHRYLCQDCKRSSREQPQPNGYTEQQREEILRAYQERSSLRGLTHTFGVACNTVSDWLKKEPTLPPLSKTLTEPDLSDLESTILELDEMWFFVLRRVNKRWVWLALCRATRQVVAYVIGDRSK
jgi:predicted Fe-S protein YdhL (DUF1289 family)